MCWLCRVLALFVCGVAMSGVGLGLVLPRLSKPPFKHILCIQLQISPTAGGAQVSHAQQITGLHEEQQWTSNSLLVN